MPKRQRNTPIANLYQAWLRDVSGYRGDFSDCPGISWRVFGLFLGFLLMTVFFNTKMIIICLTNLLNVHVFH